MFRSELDDIGEGNDHFPSGVSVSVGVLVAGTEGRPPLEAEPWVQDDTFHNRSSQVIFTTTLERDETVDNFGILYNFFFACKCHLTLNNI